MSTVYAYNRTSLIDVLGTALLVIGFWALGYGRSTGDVAQ